MKDKIYISVIVFLIIALVLSVKSCKDKDSDLQIKLQNIEALKDITRKTTTLYGQLQYEKSLFMGSLNDLKGLNQDLYKELKAQRENPRVITKIITQLVIDTIYVENKVNKVGDSSFVINFNYQKRYDDVNSLGFKGSLPARIKKSDDKLFLESSTTTITDLDMRMKLFTGIREEDGIYKIFARTDFPGISFDLDGAIVDPEKSFVNKREGAFSIIIGGGLGYGSTLNGMAIIPNVGLFVGLNLLKF